MNRTGYTITAATLVALAAGAGFGQSDSAQREHAKQHVRVANGSSTLEFHEASKLIGKDVADLNGEVVASIQDFIIDRGSGRLEHALLKSGDIMGVGGKTIAVPYGRLGFDSAKERFELDMSKEQIERASAFVPENWSELKNVSWADKLDQWWYGEGNEPGADSAVQRAIKSGERKSVKGTVRSVERVQSGRGEQIVVRVQAADGSTETLNLGPSWFVMGSNAAPMRGDEIQADTVRLEESGSRVAISATIDGDKMVFRGDDGAPRWRAASESSEKTAKADRAGRLMLLRSLIGAEAMSTDKTGGEVQSVIVERQSGQIALIGFDPNENLLGIADEIKCVPWPVVSVGSDLKVRIDADSAILKSCEKMPEDVTVYQVPARMEAVYTIFAVRPVTFTARDRSEASRPAGENWSKDGFYSKLFRDGSEATVSGKVVDVRTTELRDGMPDARIVVVATEAGEQSVILGPEWYLKQQSMPVRDGSRITVHGRSGTIAGKTYICAQSIESDGKSLTLWQSDSPMWDGR